MEKLKYKIDKVTLLLSSVMMAAMMVILFINIVLRYMPGFGGFRWYMESSQYLNVWAMFVVGISISLNWTHLNVNILEDNLKGRGKIIIKIVIALFTMLFYIGTAYGTYLLATKSRQVVSTMPYLKMAYIYWLIPVASILSAISTLIGCICEIRNIDLDKGGYEK